VKFPRFSCAKPPRGETLTFIHFCFISQQKTKVSTKKRSNFFSKIFQNVLGCGTWARIAARYEKTTETTAGMEVTTEKRVEVIATVIEQTTPTG